MVTKDVLIAALLRLFPQEENHEETQQSGNVVCFRSACYRRWCTNYRQLEKRQQRTGLEKRHQRTVLARCQLDACYRSSWLRRRNGAPAAARWLPPLPLPPLLRPAPLPAAPAAQLPQPDAATKVTYAADAFFDFDKSVLKPEGKAKLDDLVGKIKGINLEVIIAVGHTDSVGSDAYNQKLSVRRSEAVKAYLVSKGIEKNRVYTEGKGEKQPVADNKTAEGRAKNRRVEIEVVGTRANK
jgi:OOP family OmpA-OmpF porin